MAGVGGAAALGGGVLGGACFPGPMGAAAIVGKQRITQSTLDTQVANFNHAAAKYPGQVTVKSADVPKAVLSAMINFAIEDRVAGQAGITVSNALVQQMTTSAQSQLSQQYGNAELGLLNNGIPPQMLTDLGRYEAQVYTFELRANGGTIPSTSAEQAKVSSVQSKAVCTAAKSLNVQVNPQYGRFDYSQYTVVPGPDLLSPTEGTPAPAPTTGLKPAC